MTVDGLQFSEGQNTHLSILVVIIVISRIPSLLRYESEISIRGNNGDLCCGGHSSVLVPHQEPIYPIGRLDEDIWSYPFSFQGRRFLIYDVSRKNKLILVVQPTSEYLLRRDRDIRKCYSKDVGRVRLVVRTD